MGCLHLSEMEAVVSDYHQKNGKFPLHVNEIEPFLIKDAWKRDVKYILEPNLIIVISSGDDGNFGTNDDVSFIRDFAKE